jgi:uncharacterized membrane protein YphA (DoxX/SURF4 family)
MQLLTALRKRIFEHETSAIGLAAFRVAYGMVLLGEVCQLIYFRPLIFGELPFQAPAEVRFEYVLWAWAAAVLCLIFGLHTRVASIVNYILTLVTFSTFQQYEYHADHIYIGLNLLLIFTPTEKCLSLDNLRRRIKDRALPASSTPVSNVASFHLDSILLVALGLVYFDSVFWKLDQRIWQNGLGLWLPMSLPHDTWLSVPVLNSMLNRRELMSFLSDLTLVFEGLFLVLMWFRAVRPALLVIGAGMHLSILFAFPIPFFGLSLFAVYLLMVPPDWYQALGRRVRRQQPLCQIYFDASRDGWRVVLTVLEHFDIRRNLAFAPVAPADVHDLPTGLLVVEADKHYTGMSGLCQALRAHSVLWPLGTLWTMALSVPWPGSADDDRDNAYRFETQADLRRFAQRTVPSKGAVTDDPGPKPPTRVRDVGLVIKFAIVAICVMVQSRLILKTPTLTNAISSPTPPSPWLTKLERYAHGYLGICSHCVFLDGHFDNYDHILAVTWLRPDGEEVWLPLARSNGQVGSYVTGRIWAKWAFRCNAPTMDRKQIESALRDFTAFWALKNNVNLANARFKILVKKYDSRSGWERNYLRRQAEKPWSLAGWAQWRNGQFSAELIDVERL